MDLGHAYYVLRKVESESPFPRPRASLLIDSATGNLTLEVRVDVRGQQYGYRVSFEDSDLTSMQAINARLASFYRAGNAMRLEGDVAA